ncbi:hypothetical protein EON83_00185 [bacterium]|nr:MAG: hypothetical protein EON83_00185 [bacterium]
MTKTPLQRKFLESGHSLDWAARRLKDRATGNRRKDARELETAKRRFQTALRRGGCSEDYARRVAVLLGVADTRFHDLLLKPRACWPSWALDGGEPRDAKTGQGNGIHEPKRTTAARPTRKYLDTGRLVILEVL